MDSLKHVITVVTGGPPPVVFPGPWVLTEPPCSLGCSCRPPAASMAAFRLAPNSQINYLQGQERAFHTISGGTLDGLCHHLPGSRKETDSWEEFLAPALGGAKSPEAPGCWGLGEAGGRQ